MSGNFLGKRKSHVFVGGLWVGEWLVSWRNKTSQPSCSFGWLWQWVKVYQIEGRAQQKLFFNITLSSSFDLLVWTHHSQLKKLNIRNGGFVIFIFNQIIFNDGHKGGWQIITLSWSTSNLQTKQIMFRAIWIINPKPLEIHQLPFGQK